jgi:hypothetical protein
MKSAGPGLVLWHTMTIKFLPPETPRGTRDSLCQKIC